MNILVVNADCIFVNTSANLCHLAYLYGMVEAGHQVDLLCADSINRNVDSSMKLPEQVRLFTYSGLGFYEWMSMKKRGNTPMTVSIPDSARRTSSHLSFLRKIVTEVKQGILSCYGVHGIYSTFVRRAVKFHSEQKYDYLISMSTPAASHLLAHRLLKSGHVSAKHWIQIWEDPWYSDAYGFNGKKKIKFEEQKLLSFADKVCYVSPLTLRNQQRIYPESAEKMFWQPLPYYYKQQTHTDFSYDRNLYGYFGAYYPTVRDLGPFYEAACEAGISVNICGDPSNLYTSTENIHIHPRMPLHELKKIEDKTNILIFLCNRKGGQIPGKIYQYSATEKTILFILDGTEEEKQVLRSYFAAFNRYVFCQNTKEDIAAAIRKIEVGDYDTVCNKPLECFNPVITINKILEAAR